MASHAKSSFLLLRQKARRLTQTATDVRLRPLTYLDMEPGLQAGLAALVSAWESYVEAVVRESLTCLFDPSNPSASQILSLLRLEADHAIGKFNTPNYQNSRELILRFTGFDSINSMQSPRLLLNSPQTQTRLDEIIKIRHSFAHGFPIPGHPWLLRYGVTHRLTKKSIKMAETLITDLVTRVDSDLSTNLKSRFASLNFW